MGSKCVMDFSRGEGLNRLISYSLYPRSLIILEGAARKLWRHVIGSAAIQTDGRSALFTRINPRWSLTFRTTINLKSLLTRGPTYRNDQQGASSSKSADRARTSSLARLGVEADGRSMTDKRGLVRLKNLPTKVSFSTNSKEPLIEGKPIVARGGYGRVLSKRSRQILTSQEGGGQSHLTPY